MMWNLADSTPTNPTPIISDFEIGWNWTTVPWNAGNLIATRRYHCNDFRYRSDSTVRNIDEMRRVLLRDGIPDMQLIPCVKGIGQAEGVRRVPPDTSDDGEEKEGTNPSEAVAMEFAPWLYPIGSTEHFDLKANDATGAVFGWKTHRRGEPVDSAGTYRMRYKRKPAGSQPSTDPILEGATPDGELRAWTPWNSPYDKQHYEIQNTKKMEIAVTLRRSENDTATGDKNDTVLVIEVPYAKGTNSQLNCLIRLHHLTLIYTI
jgi:hypothetical protein